MAPTSFTIRMTFSKPWLLVMIVSHHLSVWALSTARGLHNVSEYALARVNASVKASASRLDTALRLAFIAMMVLFFTALVLALYPWMVAR